MAGRLDTNAMKVAQDLRDRYCPGVSVNMVEGTPIGVFRRADKIHDRTGEPLPDCFLQSMVGETFDACMKVISGKHNA